MEKWLRLGQHMVRERSAKNPGQIYVLEEEALERIAELERALKEIRGYGLTAPLGVEPTADHYRRCCGDMIGIAACALGDG